MNYRHAYHAGNFADIVKHAVLARCIAYMQRKEKAFRILDIQAGIGLYDLRGDQAGRTGEWEDGIGRLLAVPLPKRATALLSPFLEAVAAANGAAPGELTADRLAHYPGSPWLARHLLRPQDRLTAIELHPQDARTLKSRFAGDFQTRIIELDGWLALPAQMPPKERRGLVLIDPAFEREDDFERMVDGLVKALRRFAGGTFLLWYPIKNQRRIEAYRRGLSTIEDVEMLDLDFAVAQPEADGPLVASGLTIVNPPFVLIDELRVLLPALLGALGRDDDAEARLRHKEKAGAAWRVVARSP